MGCTKSKLLTNDGWEEVKTWDEESCSLLRASLRKNTFFFGLQTVDLDEIIKCLKRHTFRAKDVIYKCLDESDAMYILLKGHCILIQEDVKHPLLAKGAIIGDEDVMQHTPRSASLHCVEDGSVLLKLSQDDYHRIIASYLQRKISSCYETLYESNLLKNVPITYLKRIEEICQVKKYKKGEMIFKKGERSSLVYIVRSGMVEVSKIKRRTRNSSISTFGAGCNFGEEALLEKSYGSTIIAAGIDPIISSTTAVDLEAMGLSDETVVVALDCKGLKNILGTAAYGKLVHEANLMEQGSPTSPVSPRTVMSPLQMFGATNTPTDGWQSYEDDLPEKPLIRTSLTLSHLSSEHSTKRSSHHKSKELSQTQCLGEVIDIKRSMKFMTSSTNITITNDTVSRMCKDTKKNKKEDESPSLFTNHKGLRAIDLKKFMQENEENFAYPMGKVNIPGEDKDYRTISIKRTNSFHNISKQKSALKLSLSGERVSYV